MINMKKGISLIVLVITIIVMIIIASVIIISLTNSNILNKANEGVFKSNIKSYQEDLSLWIANEKAKDVKGFDIKEVNKSGEEMQEIITSMTTADIEKFAIEKGQLVYLENISETEKTWVQEIGLKEAFPYQMANSAVVEGTIGTSLTVHSTINGQNPSCNNPVIPAGFHAVNTSEASWGNVTTDWDKGLVIEDNDRNQFVWVPIDETNVTYAKNFTYPANYSAPSTNTQDDTLPSDFDLSKITETYKGFYIGRYETSFDYNGGQCRAKSTKSTDIIEEPWARDSAHTGYLWNFINYVDAKKYSESMDGSGETGYYGYDYDTTKVGTNLATGIQWDTVMKWVSTTTASYTGKSVTNSSDWGNYNNATFPYEYPASGTKAISTSILLNTGAASKNRAKNIYDLAGNLWEWTTEKYLNNFVYRGGSYPNSGSSLPAAYRNNYIPSHMSERVGFRVVLYIK